MTKNHDFKQLVRARMAKTGESYTAARLQLAKPDQSPTPDEYADLGGMSNEVVAEKTGRTWAEWVDVLDGAKAYEWSHAAIAKHLHADFSHVGPWWTQTVTVGYERIKGLRVKGQLCTGDFAASKSKTFPVPVDVLFAAFHDDVRAAWMGAPTVLRTATTDRSMRLTWPDGTVVAAWFTAKGPKSSVAIQHDKLESPERREAEKLAWAERFATLGVLLEI
jgi:hypothetical protein